MDHNLSKYNKINANLGYIVDDLRTRQEHMQDLIKKNRSKIRANDNEINRFKNAVYWVVQYIDDFEDLRRAININLYPIVKQQGMKNVEINPDIKKEYDNQRRYLENAQNSLQKRLQKEQQINKEDNMNIMRENIKLIHMIAKLRDDVKDLTSKEKNTRTEAKMRANQSQMMQGSKMADEKSQNGTKENPFNSSRQEGMMSEEQQVQQNELNLKRQYIENLRQQLMGAQEENEFLRQEFDGQMQQLQEQQMAA